MNSDENTRLSQWVLWTLAATKIQKKFRNWKEIQNYRYAYFKKTQLREKSKIQSRKTELIKNRTRGLVGQHLKHNNSDNNTATKVAKDKLTKNDSVEGKKKKTFYEKEKNNPLEIAKANQLFEKILSGDVSDEEKIPFWRNIIELRKIHPNRNTDIIIKALKEARLGIGKINIMHRASVLLGTKEFYEHRPFLTLTQEEKLERGKMLPIIESSTDDIITPEDISQYFNHHNVTAIKQHGVELIRMLRDRKKRNRNTEVIDIINRAINKSYLSKLHGGKVTKKGK